MARYPLICGLAKIARMSPPPPPEVDQVPCGGLQQENGAVHESLQGPGSFFMQDHVPWRVDEDLDIRPDRGAGVIRGARGVRACRPVQAESA